MERGEMKERREMGEYSAQRRECVGGFHAKH
jgi:hypothetical protein